MSVDRALPTVSRPVRRHSRIIATALVVVSLVSASVVGSAAVATADTVPINPSETPSVSTDSLPTAQMNGIAWSQVVIGNVVYVGGKFTRARPAGSPAGSNEVARNNILAYNITTGVLVPGFAPSLNGEVRATAASPDGTRLYVGGAFTTVNGTSRNRIAAFDTATGALVSNFNPNANFTVNSIVASNSTVWLGGGFSTMAGQQRRGAAAVAASGGALQPWAPVLAGGKAFGLALSPDQTKVVLGGNFTSLNGGTSPGYGLGMVASTGTAKTNLPFRVNEWVRNGGVNGAITSIHSDADGVYGSGYDFGTGANFEGTFRASWSDGTIIWLEDCHGDSYSVFATAGLVYKAGHPHYCGNIGSFPQTDPWTVQRGVAFTKQPTRTITRNVVGNYFNFQGLPGPTLVQWLPDFNTGTISGAGQGPWSVAGDTRYIVYGGEFTQVNFSGQQGLARFAVKTIAPNRDGPRVRGSAYTATAQAGPGSVTVRWTANYDRDNELLTYRVYRSGTAAPVREITSPSRWWSRPSLSIVDSGLTGGQSYTYTVRVLDPYGNFVNSVPVTAVADGGGSNQPPVASFTTSTNNLVASFDGRGSTDPGGTVTNWAWSYGDGATGTGSTSSHTYAAAGTYTVGLTVTDNGGASAGTSRSVTVANAPPPAGGIFAADDFGRTTAGGWGSAPTGGAWSLVGAASNFSVGSGVGAMTAPTGGSNLQATLGGAVSSRSNVTVRTSLQQAVTGSPAYVSLIGRAAGGNDYRARLVFAPTGGVNIQLLRGGTTLQAAAVPGLTYTPGESLRLRVQVVGTSPTTIQTKVWRDGTAEPTTWALTASDSDAALQSAGGTGLGFYIGGPSTGLPRVAQFDNFTGAQVP